MSLIIVPTDSKGLTIAPPEKKMGAGGTHSHEVRYDKVVVPAGNLLGTEGEGLQQTLTILDGGRIAVGALSVGIAQAALEEGVRYARQRQQFGVPIAQHQSIQTMIADMATQVDAARLMVYRAAAMKDKHLPYSKESAMAKLFAAETATRVTDLAVQIHGGYGYSKAYAVERYWRDARVTRIYEGTSEVHRMVIAKSVLLSLIHI